MMSIMIGKTLIDVSELTPNEMREARDELEFYYDRKAEHQRIRERLDSIIKSAKSKDFALCNRDTGEVFNLNDWCLYDNQFLCSHGDEVGE